MSNPSAESGFPIKIAARRSGLTSHIIRAWEKRYGVVKPARSETKRRLYSDAEIARLSLLRQATAAGHSIGQIAQLDDDRLRVLAVDAATAPSPAKAGGLSRKARMARSLDAAYEAIARLDMETLERELQESLVEHGRLAVMHHLIVPLIERISAAWESGELRVIHEHVASGVIRTLLGNFVRAHSDTMNGPRLLVTTPTGQMHEIGALLAGATAVDHGWRVTYLGPSLPPDEIAGAYVQSGAHALALSLVYPMDDPSLSKQLRLLRGLLPPGATILAGGRAAREYRDGLTEAGATVCEDLEELVVELNKIRERRVV